jgi:alpha-glucosidase
VIEEDEPAGPFRDAGGGPPSHEQDELPLREPRKPDGTPWWRSAVIYQVYPRSFADTDGDGIGDLPGIRQRLPHLADLGVDAVWLSPFYRSPMVDGGYDVIDYRAVEPVFGTLADFDALLADAHRLGIRVIIDIVPNHSSAQHPWFVQALAAEPGSPERDRYIFRPGRAARDGQGQEPPNDWESIFGGPAWTRAPDGQTGPPAGEAERSQRSSGPNRPTQTGPPAGEAERSQRSSGPNGQAQWYLHLFDPSQPDFNWHNLDVQQEFDSVLRFWLDRGVDGFRIDVAHGMIKAEGLPDAGNTDQRAMRDLLPPPYFDQDGVHEIYRAWRKLLDSYPGERMAVAEAWASSPQRLATYVAPDELHQAFNFDFLKASWSATAFREVIDASLATMRAVGAPPTWVLSNHDKQRHVTRYGDGPVGLVRARAALLLMLALPGSAYLYQGEELGLPEVLDLPDDARQDPIFTRSGGADPGRDGCRVPLPWSGDAPPFGFGPAGAWLPQPPSWAARTVEAQAADPDSTLRLYQAALRVRRRHPALGHGSTERLEWLPAPPDVLVFRRPPGLVCAVNLSAVPVPLPMSYGHPLLRSAAVTGGVLPPDTAVWCDLP